MGVSGSIGGMRLGPVPRSVEVNGVMQSLPSGAAAKRAKREAMSAALAGGNDTQLANAQAPSGHNGE